MPPTTDAVEKAAPAAAAPAPDVQKQSDPFVTVWQMKDGGIRLKLSDGITPAGVIALLELASFIYKAQVANAMSRPAQPPAGSEPDAKAPASATPVATA